MEVMLILFAQFVHRIKKYNNITIMKKSIYFFFGILLLCGIYQACQPDVELWSSTSLDSEAHTLHITGVNHVQANTYAAKRGGLTIRPVCP